MFNYHIINIYSVSFLGGFVYNGIRLTMQIQVVSAIGGGAPISLSVEPHDTVSKLKAMVAQERRIPASTVIVVFRGQQLDDADSIKSVGMTDGDKCYLITRTEGGY